MSTPRGPTGTDGESAGGAVSLRPADEAILGSLAASRAEYPALIARRSGLHVPYVRDRCERLDELGLIEAVSGEVVYRITSAGRDRVEHQ